MRLRVVSTFLLCVWLIAMSTGGVQAAGGAAVTMRYFAFHPATITIPVGGSVTWTNGDSVPHNAVANDNSWGTALIATGDQQTVTFATTGTFAYKCTIHPEMTGTITVTAALPATDTAPSAPSDQGSLELAAALGAALAGFVISVAIFRRRRLSS